MDSRLGWRILYHAVASVITKIGGSILGSDNSIIASTIQNKMHLIDDIQFKYKLKVTLKHLHKFSLVKIQVHRLTVYRTAFIIDNLTVEK
jgi:hypothetical protein